VLELFAYLSAIWLVNLLDVGIPAFIAARRLGVRSSAVALVPIGDLYTLAGCAGRNGWSRVWPTLLVWIAPIALMALAIGLYLSGGGDGTASLGPSLPFFGVGLIPYFVIRGLWREVCWETDQGTRLLWVAGLPVLGALRSWPIALRVPRQDKAAPHVRLDSHESVAVASDARPATGPEQASAGVLHDRITSRRQRARPPVWLLSNIVVIAAVGGFLWLDKEHLHLYAGSSDRAEAGRERASTPVRTPTPEVDRVVDVIRKCDIADHMARLGYTCEDVSDFFKANDRIEITVRSAAGGSYIVTLPPTSRVRVGDSWDPR
jgi:hypothetical protein